jgi:uncharacterized protein (DUF2141 family)
MKRSHLFRLVPAVVLLGLFACANIQSPTGGPKDKAPPKLVSSIPPANQVNFHGLTVFLQFDETVKLNNPREEIIISPSIGKDVEFTVKNNRVFITPKEKWRDSTTYSILFREGIQDITESNVPPNLKLAFSTGAYIDSLVVGGQVTDVLTGLARENITVAIYDQDTFDIFKHTPAFFTKSDKHGMFALENIRPGNYRIYAFDDKNKNLKVESRSEMFGFLSKGINLTKKTDTIALGIVQLDSRPLKMSSIRNVGNVTRVRFSKQTIDYTLESTQELVHSYADNTSEVVIVNPKSPDSLQVRLIATDSLQATADSTFFIKHTDVKPVVDKFTWSPGSPSINPENARMVTTFKFSKPWRSLRYDSVYIQVDTSSQIFLTPENFILKPKRRELVVSKDLPKKMFGEDQNPILMLKAAKGLAISMDGDTTKAFSVHISISWPEENGTVMIQATTQEKKYVLQLLDKSSRKIIGEAINTPRLTARNIPPSEYQVRAIIDHNGNGRWDPGNYLLGIEPEPILYYTTADGKSAFPIRANWEIGPLEFKF